MLYARRPRGGDQHRSPSGPEWRGGRTRADARNGGWGPSTVRMAADRARGERLPCGDPLRRRSAFVSGEACLPFLPQNRDFDQKTCRTWSLSLSLSIVSRNRMPSSANLHLDSCLSPSSSLINPVAHLQRSQMHGTAMPLQVFYTCRAVNSDGTFKKEQTPLSTSRQS